MEQQVSADAAANSRDFFTALNHCTGYALTVGAVELVDVATERYGLAGPLSGVLGDVVNAGVEWSVAEVFEGPVPVDTASRSAWDTGLDLRDLRNQHALLIHNAVYESVPLGDVPPGLRSVDGDRVPLTEMTSEQRGL